MNGSEPGDCNHQSAGKADAVWIDAADAAISGGGVFDPDFTITTKIGAS